MRLRILARCNDLNRKRGHSPKYLCIGIYLHPCYIMDNSCFEKVDGEYMPILKVPKRYELTKRSGRLRRNMTRQEKHIWYDYLRKLPFTINRQMIIGSYIVDFYCAKAGIVIEIDGIQHYWKKQYLYDKKRTEKLESYGLQVIRFTNKEIDTKFESICIFMDKIFNEHIKESF